MSLTKFIRSVRYALRGLNEVWAHEHSFRVHVLALLALIVLLFALPFTPLESALLILVAVIVLVLELVNSIFERFLDIVSPRVGAQVRDMKDIMAGAVLVASVGAVVVGALIIIPYLHL
jgi:diacylglycerol kinase